MKLYENDSRKNSELRLRIGTGDRFSFDELRGFRSHGLLEDFDLFHISSDHFDDMFMYYYKGNYYLISRGRNIRALDPQLLRNRHFTVATRSITNNVQRHAQLYGTASLLGLDKQALLKIIMGKDYKKVAKGTPKKLSDIDFS